MPHLYQSHLTVVHGDEYQDIVLVEMHALELELNDHQNMFVHGEHDFSVVDKEDHLNDLEIVYWFIVIYTFFYYLTLPVDVEFVSGDRRRFTE